MVEALTIRCTRCGADIRLARLAPSVTCSYCGNVQAVDPALARQLDEYSEKIRGELAGVEAERKHAEAWKWSTKQMSGRRLGWNYVMAFGLMGGLPMIVSLVSIALLERGVLPRDNPQYISFAAMGAAFAGMALYFAWYFALGRRRTRAGRAEAAATCPSCGALNVIEAGRSVGTCSHCGAALLPSSGVQEMAVEAARSEARRARLERHRAEREGMAAIYRRSMVGSQLVWIIGGSFLVPFGGGALVFTAQMATGEEPWSPGILILWAMLLGILGVMAGILGFQKVRKRRIREGLEGLCARYRGRILGGLQGTASWLNAHWAGPFDVRDLTRGTYNQSAELTVAGRPALVDLDPVAPAKQIRPRALVLVACDLPGMEGGAGDTLRLGAGAREKLTKVEAAGFGVEFNEGGLLARADDLVTRSLVAEDGAVARLAPVIEDLGELAGLLGRDG